MFTSSWKRSAPRGAQARDTSTVKCALRGVERDVVDFGHNQLRLGLRATRQKRGHKQCRG